MHISYSELKLWAECAWKHNLVYKKKIKKFVGNEYTAFGRALHTLCEHTIENKIQEEDYDDFFEVVFEKELMDLMSKDVELNEQMTNDMLDQAKKISPQIIPQVIKSFKNYEVFSVEERLYEDIPEVDENFEGILIQYYKSRILPNIKFSHSNSKIFGNGDNWYNSIYYSFSSME